MIIIVIMMIIIIINDDDGDDDDDNDTEDSHEDDDDDTFHRNSKRLLPGFQRELDDHQRPLRGVREHAQRRAVRILGST